MATLAFIALAFDITRNQTAVAIVLILRLVPPIFAAPVGGVLADRLDRRLIMVTCDLSRAALIVLGVHETVPGAAQLLDAGGQLGGALLQLGPESRGP